MNNKFLIILLLICITLIAFQNKKIEKENQSVITADNEYMKLNLKLSRKILNSIVQDSTSVIEEKVKALQRLAVQDWKFYRDYNQAQKRLSIANSLAKNRCKTYQILSRIEREAGYFTKAQAAAKKASQHSQSLSEKKESDILFAQAIHDKSMKDLSTKSNLDKKLLIKASTTLKSVLSNEAGHTMPSKLLLGISLLLKDGATVFEAWLSYFHFTQNQVVKGILEKPAKILRDILPKWKGGNLSKNDRKQLVFALAESRFFNYAALLASDFQVEKINEDPQIREILQYSDFINDVRQITNEYYRQISLDKQNEETYRNQLWGRAKALWKNLSFNGTHPDFSKLNFRKEMSRRFGTVITTGTTGNYQGYVLIMGHRIIDNTKSIKQYTYKADFHYICIDMMASNGYSSWFWDGKACIGGWGLHDTMMHIREAYMNEPFEYWRMVTDPKIRKETEYFIKKRETIENDIAKKNPYTDLPGIVKKLQFNAANRLLNKLKSQGLKGTELCLAFIQEFEKYKLESIIFAHEGRHSIDQKFFAEEFDKWSMDEREFRAKISQIVFASDPKWAFSDILGGATGDYGHRKANKRIRDQAMEWMKKHINQIKGVDRNSPLLPQFHLLTENQVKNCFKSADPANI